jgi:PKD repeat protein
VVPEAGRDQAPVPDLAASGNGEGIDDGALGGPDQGGGPDDLDQPDQPGGGSQTRDLDGDQTSEPVPDTDPPGGQPNPENPGTVDPGTVDPGTVDPGPGQPQRSPVKIVVSQQGAEIDEPVRFTAEPLDPDDTLSDVDWTFAHTNGAIPDARASGNPVNHAFDRAGGYLVGAQGTLRTGSEPARTVSAQISFDVLEPTVDLVAEFTGPTSAETDQQVSFTNLSTGATRYTWTFEGANNPNTSIQRTPAPQIWDTAGTFTVTLAVERGTARREVSRDIVISEPLPELPEVGPITPSPAGPYDTTMTITFRADLTRNPWDECFFIIEGRRIDCSPTPVSGGTRFSANHRFTTEGSKTITLTVGNARGSVSPTPLVIDVDELTPPIAVLNVTAGAEPDGSGGWITDDRQAVTFDGRASRGDYEEWQWLDETTGATANGPTWTVTLDGGQHVITLTVVSNRQGGLRSSASASVDVRIVEQAPVEVWAIIGDALGEGLAGQAFHPFDPIARIQLFGRFVGVCIDENGVETPYDVDRRGATPLVEAGPSELPDPAPDGTVTFHTGYDFCPPGQLGPVSQVEFWAVAYTEAGERGESEHIIRP